MSDKERGKIEEGQVSPQGRGHGRTRSGKVQSWNLGGYFRTQGLSSEALEDCGISWAL